MTSRLAAWRCADTLQICTASNADHGAAAANVYPGFRGERRGREKERRVRQEGEEGGTSALLGEVHFSQNAPTNTGGRGAYARVSSHYVYVRTVCTREPPLPLPLCGI